MVFVTVLSSFGRFFDFLLTSRTARSFINQSINQINRTKNEQRMGPASTAMVLGKHFTSANGTRDAHKLFEIQRARYSTASKTANDYKSIKYWVADRVANIQLNRPERMNAIDLNMPMELEQAVDRANCDSGVKVLLLHGNTVFCSGYDLKQFAEEERGIIGSQEMPWDPYKDYQFMSRCNKAWMSLWHSLKPVVCKIKGVAIGGGSDMALCCDITFMADDARIGYPPSRVWGCPTTAMWVYRIGMEKAKRILFSGSLIRGKDAEKMGLIGESVPEQDLDRRVDEFIKSIIEVPTNQLFFQKQVINQAMEQMGVLNTQRLATVFDGMSRHTPEGVGFQERAMEVGFKQAVKERDSGLPTAWSNLGDNQNCNKTLFKLAPV